jgi:hypothetical protein
VGHRSGYREAVTPTPPPIRFIQVPGSTLAALARGGGGAAAVRLLRQAQVSKNLLMTRAAAESAVRRGHPEAHRATRGYRLLRTMIVRAPEAAGRVLDSPRAGLWALHTLQAVERGDPLGAGTLDDLIRRVGAAPAREIETDADGLGVRLRLDDLDSRYLGDTPVDHALAGDPCRLAHWRADIADGWRLLVRHHRPIAEEFAAAMSVLVPVRRDGDGHFSATLRHGFGMLIMSRPPDRKRAALTFAHELMHAKLAAIMDLFRLVVPGSEDRFYAPWRPDPRPASALLQGIYAHLGVAAFWQRQKIAESDTAAAFEAEVEFVRWRGAAADATRALLRRDVLTPTGLRFVSQMAEQLARFEATPVSTASRNQARQLNDEHRRRWQR